MKDSRLRDQRRAYFRLRYPHAECPTILIDGYEHQVLEISEYGARVVLVSGSNLAVRKSFSGLLQFRDGASAAVCGVVLRADKQLVLQLSEGVSRRILLAEQRRLLKKYPEQLNGLL